MSTTLLQGLSMRSIRERLVLTIGLLVLIIIAFQVFYFPWRFMQTSLAGLQSKATAVLRQISYSAIPGLEFEDHEHVQEIISAAAEDPDLVYIAVYNGSGELFATWAGRGTTPSRKLSWGQTLRVEDHDNMLVLTSPLINRDGMHGAISAAFSKASIRAAATDNLVTTLVLGLGLLMIGLFIATQIGNLMRRRILAVSNVAQAVAAGNLRQAPLVDPRNDEIGVLARAFNDMVKSQQYLVQQIADTARQIKDVSTAILASARQQEQGATEQSSAVEETRSTMESLLQSGQQIADSAQGVLRSAERTLGNNQLIAERTATLSSHMQRITEILELIKEIAAKSDLLALNAALEGTKAGEAGRGFSLVATQMQRLAENVMGAVNAIKVLTDGVRESTSASVVATEDGTKQASDTARSARQIALIIQQQLSGTEQVTKAMDDVSEIATQTASSSKQSLKTTREMNELSQQLEALVNRFEVSRLGEP